MTVVVISKGSHARNTHLPPLSDGPRHFAHRWDADDPEDVPHQANNFRTYAASLGGFEPPFILLRPDVMPDEPERAHVEVNLSDWASIVKTATGVPVEIR
jgi:hypothetical protein